MPAKFIQDGNAIDHTPGADVPVGTVVVQGDLVGVSQATIKAGQLGSLAVTGVFEFPKVTGDVNLAHGFGLIYGAMPVARQMGIMEKVFPNAKVSWQNIFTTAQQRDALDFFPFPVLDFAQPPAEVVMAIGYMIPSQAPNRETALAFVGLLASAEGRDLLATDIAATGLYAPMSGSVEDQTLPENVRQGIELVQGAEAITAPYYMSVPPTMWPALMNMQRKLLTEPGSGKDFDLDGLLAMLEAAR